MASYLTTEALLLTARPALFENFLVVEGASHGWVSCTLCAILTVSDWEVALIAFHFLGSLRRLWLLRDSRALDT